MTFKTHIVFAEMVALPPILYLYAHHQCNFTELKLYAASVAVGALLPDIDHANSYISKRVPIIPELLSLYTKHRGFTHSLLGMIVVLTLVVAASLFFHVQALVALGFGIGYVLHIAADALTVSGIKNFCCNKTLYLAPKPLRCKTGSIGENIYFLIFSALLFVEYSFVDPDAAKELQKILTHALSVLEKSL